MFFALFSFLAFRSLARWRLPSESNFHHNPEEQKNTKYEISQIGFHEIDNIHKGDSISVKFGESPLRLFIFISSISQVGLKHLYIDGSDSLSRIHDADDKVAFAIDADNEAIFEFDSRSYNDNHHFDHSHQKSLYKSFFNRKHKKGMKDKVKSLISKFNFHGRKESNNDDFEDYFESIGNSVSVVMWLLPKEMCGKSSLFEYGGMAANLSVEPTVSIITSKTNEEITYSNCIFSPLFNLFDSRISYDVTVGVEPTDSDNEYPSNYRASKAEIYTDNLNYPELKINDQQNNNNHEIFKPYFVKYEIKQEAKEGGLDHPLSVHAYMNRKSQPNSENSYDSYYLDFFCIAGVVESCNSSNCFHDYDVESKLILKCNDKLLQQFLSILIGVAIAIFVVIIILICLCCVGCCACCGLCCYPFCCKGQQKSRHTHHHHSTSNSTSVLDSSTIPALNPVGNSNNENDLEIPLMSIDQNNNPQQYHQPVPMYSNPPVVYVLPAGQNNPVNQPNVVYVPQNSYQIPVQQQPQNQPQYKP